MKKLIAGIALSAMFIGAVALASVDINKTHKGKSADGAKVNCVYCHKTAGMPKAKGDVNAAKKNAACAKSGCHK